MSIKARLGALERAESDGDVQVILVEGGLPDPEPLTWGALQQDFDETRGKFCARVRRQAFIERMTGVVVLGGLPDKPPKNIY